jgi:signal recognition particle subunit SRP54
MFDSLINKINKAVSNITGKNRITDINVAATIKDIRRALVEADVNYKVAKDVTDRIKDEAMNRKILINVKPGELMVKIVHDELTLLMGGLPSDINLSGNPTIILMSGLQGSGKTTFSAKLANYLKKQGKNVLLSACDVYRPAAVEQLKVLGEQIGVEVYAELDNKNPVKIAENALAHAKANNKNVLIVDTAGRLAVDEEMMKEIENIKKALNPQETLFVVDSMTGQDAVNTAKAFNDRLNFDGVVLSKLDGDTRGGAALSIRAVVDKPIKFLSMGEKLDAHNMDVFHPERMAGRILNMGDVVNLVKRMEDAYDEEENKRISAQIRKNQFNFNDFISQLQQVKRMGNIKDIMAMIPGMSNMVKDMDLDNASFTPIEAMIQSMTPKEREFPDIIEGNRRKRIAKGSGTTIQQVNNLLKRFQEMKKVMKDMNKMQASGKIKFW